MLVIAGVHLLHAVNVVASIRLSDQALILDQRPALVVGPAFNTHKSDASVVGLLDLNRSVGL
jgi:hypothetical protein